jgi:hypothetical protein
MVNAQFHHEECTMGLSHSELIRLLESTTLNRWIRAHSRQRRADGAGADQGRGQLAHRADRNERSPTRTKVRNGHREKVLITLASNLDLEIPKVRTASFLLYLATYFKHG